MSRTFRRNRHADRHNLKELVWAESRHGGQFLQWSALPPGSAAHARELAEFRSDNHPGVWSPPSWYRRVHNRAHRANANLPLRMLSSPLDVICELRPKQAGWHWF